MFFFISLLSNFDIMIALMCYIKNYTSLICNNANHPHINYLGVQHFTIFDNAMK
jgi:hypothetical protein